MTNLTKQEKKILKKALYLKPIITKDIYTKICSAKDKQPLCRANDERVRKRDMDRKVFYLRPFDLTLPMMHDKSWNNTILNCEIFEEPISYKNISFAEDIAAEGRVEFEKSAKLFSNDTYGTYEEVLKQIPKKICNVYETFDKNSRTKRNKQSEIDEKYRMVELVDYTPFNIYNIDGFTGKRFMTARIWDIDQEEVPLGVQNQDVIYNGVTYKADEVREMIEAT